MITINFEITVNDLKSIENDIDHNGIQNDKMSKQIKKKKKISDE